jgi:hypothetical protein
MDRNTFQSLSEEGKEVWDKLEPEDKKKILEGARKKVINKKRSANIHESEVTLTIENDQDTGESNTNDTGEEVETSQDSPTFDINNAIANARGKAHPGDPRRMMGKNSKPTKPSLKVGHHDLQRNATFGYDSGNESISSDHSGDSNDVDYFGSYWGDAGEDFH